MKPSSHKKFLPDECCVKCSYCLSFRGYLLCFFGESHRVERTGEYLVSFDKHEITDTHSKEFADIWTGRHVEKSDVCDMFNRNVF